MSRKKKTEEGYKTYKDEHGKRWMLCSNSIPNGKYWAGHVCDNWEMVSENTTAVLCRKCVTLMAEPPKERQIREKSDKPKGWKLMRTYVHEDGTVYFKGIEQPDLKGTLPVTVITEAPVKKKVTKQEKEEMIQDLGKEIGYLKSKLLAEKSEKNKKKLVKELAKANRKLSKLV